MPSEGSSMFTLKKQKTLIKPKVSRPPPTHKKLKNSSDLS